MKIVAYGEIMMRLTPPDYALVSDATKYDACFGGTESNVLVALSNLGNETSFVTKIPNNGLGTGVIRHLNRYGVKTENIVLEGTTLGIYFLEQGYGSKPSKVIYHRKNAVINTLLEDELSYDGIFKDASWFHVTGISLAISENSKRVAIRLCKEAKARGLKVSFDFNYRATLWSLDEAKNAYLEIIPYVDLCFGNVFDLNNLGIEEETSEKVIEKFLHTYNVTYLVYTKRKIISALTQSLKGYLYFLNDEKLEVVTTLEEEFEVLDRIGGGDAFDAGVIHILNKDFGNREDAINLGLKCDILKHLVRGDVLAFSKEEIEAFINSSKDVVR